MRVTLNVATGRSVVFSQINGFCLFSICSGAHIATTCKSGTLLDSFNE